MEPKDYSKFFPPFLWVVRDSDELDMVNDKNDTISATQLLEQTLAPIKVDCPQNAEKNKIRKQIRDFFPVRDCFAMVTTSVSCTVSKSLQIYL